MSKQPQMAQSIFFDQYREKMVDFFRRGRGKWEMTVSLYWRFFVVAEHRAPKNGGKRIFIFDFFSFFPAYGSIFFEKKRQIFLKNVCWR